MLSIGAPSWTETGQHASVNRRGVRGGKAKGCADLVMRVGVGGMIAKALLAERERLTKVRLKACIERRGGPQAWNISARLSQIVVDSYSTLIEKQADPRGGGR